MNKIIKKLHKTLFSLACTSFAISIFSFSAGANVMAERDLLLNSSFASTDHILTRVNLSAAAILSGYRTNSTINPGFFVHFDALTNLHNLGKDINLGKNIHLGAFACVLFKSNDTDGDTIDEREDIGGYIKFNFTNNFYLGANIAEKKDDCISLIFNDTIITLNGFQVFIFCGNKISIAENTNLSAELSFGISFDTDISTSQSTDTSQSTETLLSSNLNIGLDFKIEGFNVETRFSDFISVENKFIEDITKYFIGTPAFTISANKDTSWAFLSFGAKTNLNFDPKNMMGFVQATVKL